MIPTDRLLKGIFSASVAAGKILDPVAVFVALYTAGPAVIPPATIADFTVSADAEFDPVAVAAWGAPQLLLDGSWAVAGTPVTFVPASAAHGIVAAGWVLVTAAVAGNVLGWAPFGTPIALPNESHPLTLVTRIVLDVAGRWDATVAING